MSPLFDSLSVIVCALLPEIEANLPTGGHSGSIYTCLCSPVDLALHSGPCTPVFPALSRSALRPCPRLCLCIRPTERPSPFKIIPGLLQILSTPLYKDTTRVCRLRRKGHGILVKLLARCTVLIRYSRQNGVCGYLCRLCKGEGSIGVFRRMRDGCLVQREKRSAVREPGGVEVGTGADGDQGECFVLYTGRCGKR